MGRRYERYSKRGGGNSKQDDVGRTIHERVTQLMENRWKYLNPFDMFTDVEDELFRYAMTEREWEAWRVLEQNKKFRAAMSTTSQLVIRHNQAGYTVVIVVPGERIINVGVNMEALPESTFEKLSNWVIRSEAYRWECHTIVARVATLTRLCATPGQIERVWPELMGFMPGEVIDTRLEKRARSPYPDGVFEDGWELLHPNERKLKEKYRPETLAWFNDALAEALILPLQKWSEMPAYPSVNVIKT